ncbi:hypothetical protein IAE22_34205, partial [Bacillus sp. S34]|nr:hypothetical protein [Bacillus sp. S34]
VEQLEEHAEDGLNGVLGALTGRTVADAADPRVALRDDAGATLTERAVDLTWTRHGGSEQCGGPSSARTTVRP